MKAFFKNYFFLEVYFLWGKIIQERSIFITIFDIKQQRSDFGKEVSKLHSTCLEKDFEEQLILKTLQSSKIFQTLSEKFETSGGKFSAKLSKKHSTCPEELFAEKYIFEENRISVTFFGIWVKKIGLPAKKFSARYSKSHSTCPEIQKNNVRFFCTKFSYNFFFGFQAKVCRALSKKVSDFWQTGFVTLVKTGFYVTKGTFRIKKFFFDKKTNIRFVF